MDGSRSGWGRRWCDAVLRLGDHAATEAVEAFTARRAERVRRALAQNHRRDRARTLPTPVGNLVLRTVGATLFKADHAPLHATP